MKKNKRVIVRSGGLLVPFDDDDKGFKAATKYADGLAASESTKPIQVIRQLLKSSKDGEEIWEDKA